MYDERVEIGRMTEDEFLDFVQKDTTERKFEYVNGIAYVMAGTSTPHGMIVFNLGALLHPKLRGTRCHVVGQGPMVRVRSAKAFLVPDIFVFCSKADPDAEFEEEPVLIIEVLSKSTRAYDLRQKGLIYQQQRSVREYLIVHQDRQQVERWSRSGDEWEERRYTPVEGPVPVLSLPCGEVKLPFNLIYEGCEPPMRVKEEEPEYNFEP